MSEKEEGQVLQRVERVMSLIKWGSWAIGGIGVAVFWIAMMQFQVRHIADSLDLMIKQNKTLQSDMQSLKERIMILEYEFRSVKGDYKIGTSN